MSLLVSYNRMANYSCCIIVILLGLNFTLYRADEFAPDYYFQYIPLVFSLAVVVLTASIKRLDMNYLYYGCPLLFLALFPQEASAEGLETVLGVDLSILLCAVPAIVTFAMYLESKLASKSTIPTSARD
ncbi:hypothetical protein OCF84_21310 (plasmid) [Shewanella xiamenensis]|uniref:Uncharacterized protein n=1 Tax=Shewanella xiamenensis TaxID=332186 RepID=A0ABT6UDN6_9GAMM|nr:hypothetical protein [Shewanella xiamenensis]MDI5832584.1 hypothetical protein [Shewanella xiamenensis]WHF57798.1 hypothetical protein OCF84_21310 [Shewanella xiamenensis]